MTSSSSSKKYLITRYPILVGAGFVWSAWLVLMLVTDNWGLFADNWFMSVTMMAGSFIAGSTSEGGGAVAFPVMTLWFHIEPRIARDFSLLIQSVGMSAASFTIICLRVPVEWRAVLFAGLGGAIGVILGLDVISPLLTPAYSKVFFVSLWMSFAGALYLINVNRDREVLSRIESFNPGAASALFAAGVAGGIVSGIAGSGLDIVTFSLLVLAFRVCEKVGTPTSVVLMASNSLVAVLWREGFSTGMDPVAWSYWYVCVPVVVVGAPLGAWFIRDRSRHFVAGFLYLSIFAQYVAALVLIPFTTFLAMFSISTTVIGLLLFWAMAHLGGIRLAQVQTGRRTQAEAVGSIGIQ